MVSHTYTQVGAFTATLVVGNVYQRVELSKANYIRVWPPAVDYVLYLPLLNKHYAPPAPDLIVERIVVVEDDVEVVVKNQLT